MSGTNDNDMVVKELVDKGVIDESEKEFDEKENKDPDVDEKIELPHTLILEHPFKLGKNREVTEIVFRNRLTAGMLKHLPLGEKELKRGNFHPIIEKMTGEVSAVINDLDPVDWFRAYIVVSHFLI